MKLLSFCIVFVFSFLSSRAYSQAVNVWEEIDVRYYYPQEQGVKDLAFSVRKDGLTEYVKKSFHLNSVKDIYVQVYYLFPDQFRMEVHGLPNGFKEIRQSIKSTIAPFIAYVLPNKFIERYQIYQFKKISRKGGFVLKGTDPKFQAAIPEFEMSFDSGNLLTKTAANTPQGPNQTSFRYSKKRWSRSKYVLNRMTSITTTKLAINSVETDIIYEKKNGFGLPKKISITNKAELTDLAKKLGQFKNAKHSTKQETSVSFSSYEVNKSRAKQKFYRKTKKVQ